ncbi:MAG: hypothetical protein HZB46_16415 [Solirubrobacterales bacterium]|nr:hypothetical protein [Solirubrobacterales bacterium]
MVVLAVAVAVAGCGSAPVADLPPAARPAASPPQRERPAGRLIPAAARPEGLAPARRVTAAVAGRTFVADARTSTISVREGGRRVAAFRVAGHPAALSPADRGRRLAVLSGRERVLELYDPRTLRRVARATAGVGPTHVVAEADRLYVADTQGGALLVFRVAPELELVRRVHLPGSPYGMAVDPERHRLWITLTARNALVSLPANGRPRVIRTLPTVRQPDAVAVDASSGTVRVRSAGVLQLVGADEAYGEDER